MKASISVLLALLSVGEFAELSKGLRVGVTAGEGEFFRSSPPGGPSRSIRGDGRVEVLQFAWGSMGFTGRSGSEI